MEIVIAIAIVAILAAISIPIYLSYTRKAHYSVIVQAAETYKQAVAVCLELHQGLNTNCDSGNFGIPPAVTGSSGAVASISVSNGTITVTPNAANGINTTDTFILTPSYTTDTGVTWTISGGVCGTGLTNSC